MTMTARRTAMLTTTELHHLDIACRLVTKAFGGTCPYLVGSAGIAGAVAERDLDAAKHAARSEAAQWQEIDAAAADSIAFEVTKALGQARAFRDVDVRLMLDDDEFAAACPTRDRWELLCLAIGTYLAERTGLKIDFQIQRTAEASEKFRAPRYPLGLLSAPRVFAGGGDGTPGWPETP